MTLVGSSGHKPCMPMPAYFSQLDFSKDWPATTLLNASTPDTVQIRFGKKAVSPDFRAYQAEVGAFIKTYSQRQEQRHIVLYRAASRYHKRHTVWNEWLYRQETNRYAALFREAKPYQKLCALVNSEHFADLSLLERRTVEVIKEEFDRNQPPASMQAGQDRKRYYQLEDEILYDEMRLSDFVAKADLRNDQWQNQIPEGYNQPYTEVARALGEKRNRLARMHGYDNYFVMTLAKKGLDEAFLNETIPVMRRLGNFSGVTPESPKGRDYYIAGQLWAEDYGWSHLKGKSGNEIFCGTYAPLLWRDGPIMRHSDPVKQHQWDAAMDHYRASRFRYDAAMKKGLRDQDLSMAQRQLRDQDLFPLFKEMTVRMGWEPGLVNAIHYDMENRSGKTKNAFVIPVNPPFETELFVTPANEKTMLPEHDKFYPLPTRVAFHEWGHAVEFAFCDPSLPFPLRVGDVTPAMEGLGLLFEYIPSNPAWAVEKDEPLTAQEQWKIKQLERKNDLAMVWDDLASTVSNVEAERAFYENPAQSKLIKPQILLNSGFSINYLLDKVWAANVKRYMNKQFGGMLNPQAGEYLREHFARGHLLSWQDELKRMTGKRPDEPAMTPNDLPDFIEETLQALEKDFPPQPQTA